MLRKLRRIELPSTRRSFRCLNSALLLGGLISPGTIRVAIAIRLYALMTVTAQISAAT